MTFALIDWLIVAAYFAVSFGIAAYYYKRSSSGTSEFFLGGRNMPWWLAGTSMVATTFAADTPLAVTELVAQNGIAGNWLWWNAVAGGILTVFFFAKLWRRSGVMTDVEFVEMRYAGRPAAALRGIKAVYFGLLMNCIIIGWVSLAMETVLKVLFPDLTIFGMREMNVLGIQMSAALVVTALLVLMVAAVGWLTLRTERGADERLMRAEELRILGPIDLAGRFEWYQLTVQPGGALDSHPGARPGPDHPQRHGRRRRRGTRT